MTIKTASASRFYRSAAYSLSSLLSLSRVLGISLVLTGCGKSEPGIMPGEIPVMSENEVVQKAYERCVQDTQEALFKDNSVTSDEMLSIMYSGALQTCESAVVITCDKGLETDSCKIILDIYKL